VFVARLSHGSFVEGRERTIDGIEACRGSPRIGHWGSTAHRNLRRRQDRRKEIATDATTNLQQETERERRGDNGLTE